MFKSMFSTDRHTNDDESINVDDSTTTDESVTNLDLKELLKDMAKKMDEMHSANCARFDEMNSANSKRFDGLEKNIKELTSSLDSTKQLLTVTQQQADSNCQVIATLVNENRALSAQVEDLEARARRNSLVVFGLGSKPGTEDDDSFVLLAKNRLQLNINGDDLQDVHRLGRSSGEKPAPLLVSLWSNRTRDAILKAAPRLKGSKIFISPDLSTKAQQQRSILKQLAYRAKCAGYSSVKIRRSGITLDGKYMSPSEIEAVLSKPPTQQYIPQKNVPVQQNNNDFRATPGPSHSFVDPPTPQHPLLSAIHPQGAPSSETPLRNSPRIQRKQSVRLDIPTDVPTKRGNTKNM